MGSFLFVLTLMWGCCKASFSKKPCQDCFIPGYSCGLATPIRIREKVPVEHSEDMATGCIQITSRDNWQTYLLSKPSKECFCKKKTTSNYY